MKKLFHDIRHAEALSWIMAIVFILWISLALSVGSPSVGCSDVYAGYDTGWSDVCMDDYRG
jgi:hypothetical protein